MDDTEDAASDLDGAETAEADRPLRHRLTRNPSPWRTLELIDRQWSEPALLREPGRTMVSLALTTPEDPQAFYYVGAVAGAPETDVARACQAWLGAQLAADAVRLGRALRPTVELVPAGGLWHVVRAVGRRIVLLDGPGWPTPFTAASAASRRYRAELRHELERSGHAWTEEDEEESEADQTGAPEAAASPDDSHPTSD